MQLNTMDCSGRRSNNAERDSDLGDDLSHDDHTDDEMRDCDSTEGEHARARRLNHATNGGDMGFGGVGGIGAVGGMSMHSPERHTDMSMSHHHAFPANHPLNALGNFMGIGALHGIPNLPHNDVLEKLKMQVRDMKVGLMEQDYANAHAATFSSNLLPTPINTAFTLPPTPAAPFGHSVQSLPSQFGGNSAANTANGNTHIPNSSGALTAGTTALTNGGGGAGGGGGVGDGNGSGAMSGTGNTGGSFAFTSPTAPSTKDVNPASNSSTSSEASTSSQQNNGWSFEEQYKQVRQLYEINDDPKRKEFLDDLFNFMQKRGTPINRLPIMAKSVLDLYELYNLVIARGGLVDVINKKLWQEIIKGLHLPSSITSAAFTLRTQYMKYLYPYECEKQNLSTPVELQAAIDGNRREGRRSSYGQYEAMHNQLPMPSIMHRSLSSVVQQAHQTAPLALVTHALKNRAQVHAVVAAAATHKMPQLVAQEIEQRMWEYIKTMHAANIDPNAAAGGMVGGAGSGAGGFGNPAAPQKHQLRQHAQSPEASTRDAMNALEMSRVALWQMYHNNTSPPASVNVSPQGDVGANNGAAAEQRSEALNLSESPPNVNNIKREREREPTPESCGRDDFHQQQPPTKRIGSGINFPTNFYLATDVAAAAAAAAANFRHHNNNNEIAQYSDVEDDDEGSDAHNIATSSSLHEERERKSLNGHHLHLEHHQQCTGGSNGNSSNHHDKSDDSAIENSPSTSGVSAGGGSHVSPVSTKKIHLQKPQSNSTSSDDDGGGEPSRTTSAVENLSLLSGMQFQVARNGNDVNGVPQLIVNLALNGIKYSGVLIANTSATSNESADRQSKDDTMKCIESSTPERDNREDCVEDAPGASSVESSASKSRNVTLTNGKF